MMPRRWLLICLILPAFSCSAMAADISVFAASSLSGVLSDIVEQYHQQFPEDRVMLNLAGSQTLAIQIEQGAPADLFISANQPVMQRLQTGGRISDIRELLRNHLVIAMRSDLQPPLRSVHDLSRSDLLLVVGNAQVPVGNYSRQLFARLSTAPDYGPELVRQIKQNIVSEENKVKAIVAKLLLGEADAGIVYQSDLHNSVLNALPLPEGLNPLASYPLAKVAGRTKSADRFYDFLLSSNTAENFQRYGFLTGEEQ